MSEQYIKQLEADNEKLRELLEASEEQRDVAIEKLDNIYAFDYIIYKYEYNKDSNTVDNINCEILTEFTTRFLSLNVICNSFFTTPAKGSKCCGGYNLDLLKDNEKLYIRINIRHLPESVNIRCKGVYNILSMEFANINYNCNFFSDLGISIYNPNKNSYYYTNSSNGNVQYDTNVFSDVYGPNEYYKLLEWVDEFVEGSEALGFKFNI